MEISARFLEFIDILEEARMWEFLEHIFTTGLTPGGGYNLYNSIIRNAPIKLTRNQDPHYSKQIRIYKSSVIGKEGYLEARKKSFRECF